MQYEDNPKSIKYHVKKYILENKEKFINKITVDLPAGTGITSRILKEVGGIVKPFDLFPEYFTIDGLICERANVMEELPLNNSAADVIICQEGIEHFSDQYRVLKEFNRVLKRNGSLIITTPNYSNLQSRFSYLLSESESFNKIMPPNEIDSIWMADPTLSNEIYFGHIFLIGIQKLRVLAKLSGFRIKKITFVRLKSTSLALFPIFYPLIFLSSWITYRKNCKKKGGVDISVKREVYKEIFKLNISPKILLDGHLFVEFEKECEVEEVATKLTSQHQSFNVIT